MTAGLHGDITNNISDFNFKNNHTEICVCLFGVKEEWGGNYKLSSFVLLCSSASVVLNLYMDKRENYISI